MLTVSIVRAPESDVTFELCYLFTDVDFRFFLIDFGASEADEEIIAQITKDIAIANDITLQVTPYTIERAQELNLLDDPELIALIPPIDFVSPNRAQSE